MPQHPPEWPAKAHPELMTVADLAARSKLSESFWYQAIKERRCPHYRFGKGQGGIRVSVEQYEAFLKTVERDSAKKSPEPSSPPPPPPPDGFRLLPPPS